MFVGSAIKTFILAQYLREVEAWRLTEDQQVKVDDAVRSLEQPRLPQPYRHHPGPHRLEAMIAHSDNTAIDIMLAAAGPAQVRALIAEAGLKQTQIPESTRRLFSYIAGAPEGVDLGWDGMLRAQNGSLPGTPRFVTQRQSRRWRARPRSWCAGINRRCAAHSSRNPRPWRSSSASLAMADAIATSVPPDIAGRPQGRQHRLGGFNCISVAGQMIVSKVPVTFCLTMNWNGPEDKASAIVDAYIAGATDALAATAQAVGGTHSRVTLSSAGRPLRPLRLHAFEDIRHRRCGA